MKKETLELALYKVVTLELKNSDKKYYGWLVRGKYSPKSYELLPINHKQDNVICFNASYVKTITYDSNGVTLK